MIKWPSCSRSTNRSRLKRSRKYSYSVSGSIWLPPSAAVGLGAGGLLRCRCGLRRRRVGELARDRIGLLRRQRGLVRWREVRRCCSPPSPCSSAPPVVAASRSAAERASCGCVGASLGRDEVQVRALRLLAVGCGHGLGGRGAARDPPCHGADAARGHPGGGRGLGGDGAADHGPGGRRLRGGGGGAGRGRVPWRGAGTVGSGVGDGRSARRGGGGAGHGRATCRGRHRRRSDRPPPEAKAWRRATRSGADSRRAKLGCRRRSRRARSRRPQGLTTRPSWERPSRRPCPPRRCCVRSWGRSASSGGGEPSVRARSAGLPWCVRRSGRSSVARRGRGGGAAFGVVGRGVPRCVRRSGRSLWPARSGRRGRLASSAGSPVRATVGPLVAGELGAAGQLGAVGGAAAPLGVARAVVVRARVGPLVAAGVSVAAGLLAAAGVSAVVRETLGPLVAAGESAARGRLPRPGCRRWCVRRSVRCSWPASPGRRGRLAWPAGRRSGGPRSGRSSWPVCRRRCARGPGRPSKPARRRERRVCPIERGKLDARVQGRWRAGLPRRHRSGRGPRSGRPSSAATRQRCARAGRPTGS